MALAGDASRPAELEHLAGAALAREQVAPLNHAAARPEVLGTGELAGGIEAVQPLAIGLIRSVARVERE